MFFTPLSEAIEMLDRAMDEPSLEFLESDEPLALRSAYGAPKAKVKRRSPQPRIQQFAGLKSPDNAINNVVIVSSEKSAQDRLRTQAILTRGVC